MKPGVTALAVDSLFKSFRLPTRRVDTLRERLLAGLTPATTELEVLHDVSFRVGRGEFLGIAGRNGSGKSTLLKIVAGIYRPDAGEIRAAGRLAPIIELGVGFNNELAAYDNVVMNAVMMGLEPSDARARYPEILEFAELRDFEHLKLKNYSSGMRARLGFATMLHVDADLLLFDEVLAVGDAGFQEKCAETFSQLRASGRTGVLVTHSMNALRRHCDQALLLEGGRMLAAGSPDEVAREYESLRRRPLAAHPQRERGTGLSEVSTKRLRVVRPEEDQRERMAPALPQPLRPIEGPSAFGGSRRRFFNLLWLTSAQQYRLQYRTSVLGQLWAILRPLSLFGILYFVFTQVLGFGAGIEEYALMLLLGIMLFQFFADATGTALGALVKNEPMVRKMHFPRIVVPLSVVLSSGMTAGIAFLVTLGFVLVFGQGVLWTWLLVPVALLPLAILTTGVALLLSTLFVRIRDVGQIWVVVSRALFYASPILYPLESVPSQFQEIVALNPLAPILTQVRIWVLHPDAPSVVATVGWPALLASMAIGIGLCVAGFWLFVRQAPRAAELL